MMSVNLTRPGIFSLFTAILLVLPLVLCTGGPAFAYSVADTYWIDDSVGYVDVVGSRVYAPASSDGLYVFDISDPTDIQLLGHYEDENAHLGRVVVRDGYAFVNDYNFGLRVLDVHNPANITEAGSWEYTGNPYRAEGLALKDNYLYYTPWSPAPTQILDISNFNDVQQVGTFGIRDYTSEPGAVMTTIIQDDILYASYGYGGFHTIDVSNPTNPIYLDGVYHPEKSDDHRFFLRDGYAYLAGGDYGFHIIDVSDPADLADVFAHEWTEGEVLNGSYSIVLGPKFDGGLQYMFLWEGWAADCRMHVWNVTNPENPVEVAVYPKPSGYHIGAVSDYYNGYLIAGLGSTKAVRTYDVTEFHVPEPATILLATASICSIAFAVRRRRKM